MGCLYCGKEIGPFRLLRDDEFCSSRHRKEYRERLTRGLLQAQSSEFRAHKIAQFEDVLRTRDVLMEALALVEKIHPSITWRIEYSAFPLNVTEVAGKTPMPLNLPLRSGFGANGELATRNAQGSQNGDPADPHQIPDFLIPSPALNSCQQPQIEPHHPAGAAADLHVCSSPDAIIVGILNPKMPEFTLQLDVTPPSADLLKAAAQEKKRMEAAVREAKNAPPPPPRVVETWRPPSYPEPREVMPALAGSSFATDWPVSPARLVAHEMTGARAASLALLEEAIIPCETTPRAGVAQRVGSAAAAEWRERELATLAGGLWIEAKAGAARIAVREAAMPVGVARERDSEGKARQTLIATEWPAKPLALPAAVSEEMFPPELAGSEPPAVPAGERLMPIRAAVAREGLMVSTTWISPVDVTIPLVLPTTAAAIASALHHAAVAPVPEARAAEPAATVIAYTPSPIETLPAAVAPALDLAAVAPVLPMAQPSFALAAYGDAAFAAARNVEPASTPIELRLLEAARRADVPVYAFEPIPLLAPEVSANGNGAHTAELPEANAATPSPVLTGPIATAPGTLTPTFAMDAAPMQAAELESDAALAPAAETLELQVHEGTAAAAVAGPVLTNRLADPEFALQPASDFAAAAGTSQPPAIAYPMRDGELQAAALDSQPAADLEQSPWSVSESLFPFEPSLEFVPAAATLAASGPAEIGARVAAGSPAIVSSAEPLNGLRLIPLALEPEPPAYLTAEPAPIVKALPLGAAPVAPAPAAASASTKPSAAKRTGSIAKPSAPPVAPTLPAPHKEEEFQAAVANPAAALVASAGQALPEELEEAATMAARPQLEGITSDAKSPSGLILLDYHVHSLQSAPVPAFTWRWRIAPTQLPEFELRTVPARLEDLLDEKKDVVRPFFQAAKQAVPRNSRHWQSIGLIAAALLMAAIVGMGGRAAFQALRGGPSNQTNTASASEDSNYSQPTATPQAPAGPQTAAARAAKPGAIARLRQAIADRATLELNDTFQKGMGAWGQAKTMAPGWAKSPDGYVRPGQLALYQPTVGLSNYDMEFLGQIENKSMDWVVRAKDKQNYYAMKFKVIEPGLRPVIAMVHYPVVNGVAGKESRIPLNIMVHNNSAYHVSVSVEKNRIITAIEGQEVDRWIDDTLPKGGVGFFADAGERARLYWVRVSRNEDFLGRVCSYLSSSSSGERSTAVVLFPMDWMHGNGYDHVTRYNN